MRPAADFSRIFARQNELAVRFAVCSTGPLGVPYWKINMARAFALFLVTLLLAIGAAAPTAAATVVVSINGEGVTDFQVQQRLKLFQLEGRSSGKAATEELVNEALMLQEAERLGIKITEGEVDTAILNVARSIKLSVDKLKEILSQNGVGMETLRDRLRAALAWARVTEVAIAPRVQLSDLVLDQQATADLSAGNSFDYILKEIVFVMPGGRGNASQRTAQANQYRSSFSGCDNAVQLSLSYTDAAVVNVGRRHATQLPEPIAKELAGLNVGGITKPRVMETGVSMLAVCEKTAAEDTTFIKGQLRQKEGNAALTAEAEKYMQSLKAKADIRYR